MLHSDSLECCRCTAVSDIFISAHSNTRPENSLTNRHQQMLYFYVISARIQRWGFSAVIYDELQLIASRRDVILQCLRAGIQSCEEQQKVGGRRSTKQCCGIVGGLLPVLLNVCDWTVISLFSSNEDVAMKDAVLPPCPCRQAHSSTWIHSAPERLCGQGAGMMRWSVQRILVRTFQKLILRF